MNRKKNAVAGSNDQTGTVPIYSYAGIAAANRDIGISIKENSVNLVVNLRAFSSFVPSFDRDIFFLFLSRTRAHHCVLHESIYKIFSVKDRAGLITLAGSPEGKYRRKCPEHSVGPGAVSCSFQLQESGFHNNPESCCNLPEECWKTVTGFVRGIAKINAGGVKANDQAHQGIWPDGYLSDGLFFGTCALNSSRGVKKLEYTEIMKERGA